MEKTKGITFEEVEKIASGMLLNGIQPTVRGVRSVSGGKSEVVSRHVRDFFEKRDSEVSKMADEIGSGNIAKLIAAEIHTIVEKRTSELSLVNIRQKEQIDELVELLEEQVLVSEKSTKESLELVESIKSETTLKIEKITSESLDNIKKSEEVLKAANEEKAKAIAQSAEAQLLSTNAIAASKTQAQALVDAADTRAEKAEQESKLLREQVKALSIDEAKREIEKAEHSKTRQLFEQMRLEHAERNTDLVVQQSENRSLIKDITRLEEDNKEYKQLDKDLSVSQTQLVESQKMITDLNGRLSLSERERESLTLTLSHKTKS